MHACLPDLRAPTIANQVYIYVDEIVLQILLPRTYGTDPISPIPYAYAYDVSKSLDSVIESSVVRSRAITSAEHRSHLMQTHHGQS